MCCEVICGGYICTLEAGHPGPHFDRYRDHQFNVRVLTPREVTDRIAEQAGQDYPDARWPAAYGTLTAMFLRLAAGDQGVFLEEVPVDGAADGAADRAEAAA
jgi:hypothetical protein